MFKVEAKALLEGLFLAWDKGYHKIEIESDSLLLIETLSSSGGDYSSLVELCMLQQLLRRKWEVCLKHVTQDQNEVADHMAKCGISGGLLLQLFVELPNSIVGLLTRDRNGPRSF